MSGLLHGCNLACLTLINRPYSLDWCVRSLLIDKKKAGQSQMSQSVQDVSMHLPSVPLVPTFNAVAPQVHDPLLKSDPWQAFVGSPVRSQRGHDVHSGMTPQFEKRRTRVWRHSSLEWTHPRSHPCQCLTVKDPMLCCKLYCKE